MNTFDHLVIMLCLNYIILKRPNFCCQNGQEINFVQRYRNKNHSKVSFKDSAMGRRDGSGVKSESYSCKDPGLVPSTHTRQLASTYYNSSSSPSERSSPRAPALTCTHPRTNTKHTQQK